MSEKMVRLFPSCTAHSSSLRIHNPAHEQDVTGLVILDQEQERVIGPEDR
jgi:hypothetical protein